jgi:hypothetical protein
VASGAAAAPKEGFHGVAILETPSVAELQTMKRGGVDIVRVPIYWESVESSPGLRNWARYDQFFAATAAAGLEVAAHLHLSPSWMYANQQRPPLAAPAHLAAFQRFVRDFADRYGTGGLFWTLNPTTPYRPVTAYQLWNEPNLKFFWGGKPNPRGYIRLLRATRDALLGADTAGRIVTGGLFRAPRKGYGMPADRYLDRLYRQPGARELIDIVGLHPYAPTPREVVRGVADARRVMKARRDGSAKIWVTEFGWSVGGTQFKFSPVRANRKQQAGRLKQSYRMLQGRGKLGVARAFWFSWRDFDFNQTPAQDPWIFRMGLFDLAGKPRPAWRAYAGVAGGTP